MFIMPIKQFVNTVAMMSQQKNFLSIIAESIYFFNFCYHQFKDESNIQEMIYFIRERDNDMHYYRWNIFCITIQLHILNHNDFTVQNNA